MGNTTTGKQPREVRISKDNSVHYWSSTGYTFNSNKEIIKIIDYRVNGFGPVEEINIKVVGSQLNFQLISNVYDGTSINYKTTYYGVLNKQ